MRIDARKASTIMGAVAALLGGTAIAGGPPTPADVAVTPIVTTGLSGPVGIANPGDGSNRLFVIEQGGAIKVVANGAVQSTYLTLGAGTQCAETPGGALANTGFTVGSEQGLLGLAFHPSFATNGRIFLSYSGANGDTIIARITASNPAANTFPAGDQSSCVVVLRVDQDFSNHNGGNILFGPDDGYLYFGLGDGGSGSDPCSRGQTLNPANLDNNGSCASDASFTDPDGNSTPDRPVTTRALLGKMLRLDVDGTTAAGANGLCGARLDGAANYAIPASNPFAGVADNSCDEVWAYGLRNPWRWSFDYDTGDLIIGDVGQDRWEEVDLEPAASLGGVNYGWGVCEGTKVKNTCTSDCTLSGAVDPIIEYNNSGSGCSNSPTIAGCSVTGGYRYRGPTAALDGVYFFGDACSSRFQMSVESGGTWSLPTNDTRVPPTSQAALAGSVVAFGEDDDGVVYVIGGNTMYRIGDAAPVGPPDDLFENGFE